MNKPATPGAVSIGRSDPASAIVGADSFQAERVSRAPRRAFMLSSSGRSERARIAGLSRHHGAAPAVEDRRREFKTARLEEYIRKTVDSAPELTQEQRDRLALLLRAPSGGAAA